MNKQEFLTQLKEALTTLSGAEQADVLGFFEELITDKAQDRGCTEEEVIAQLGPVETVAAGVLETSSQPVEHEVEKQEPQPEPAPVQEPPAAHAAPTTSGPGKRIITAKEGSVRSIILRTAEVNISILPSDSGDLELRYEETAYLTYDFSLENGVLRLERRPTNMLLMGLRLFYYQPEEMELKLPREYAGSLDARTRNAHITMRDIQVWGDLYLKASNNSMKVRDVSARQAELVTSNARLTAERVRTTGDLLLKTSNSRLTAEHVKAGSNLTLRTSNARLLFEDVDADALTLTTSNARVEGTLPHPAQAYTVTSGTSNGKNNLRGHSHQGAKRLDVHTSNANIQVLFAEEV